jgi:uncharacterized protein (TIRG00374 family)
VSDHHHHERFHAFVERLKPSERWRAILRGLLSLAVVIGIFVGVMPRIADYSDVWATIRAMTWLEITTLVLIGAWNIVTYWMVMVAVLPGLTYGQAAVANQASTAVANTLPAGGVLGLGLTYRMYRSWGFSTADFALSALVSGVWNNFMKLGFPIVALTLLAVTGDASPALVTAAFVGVGVLVAAIVILVLVLRSEAMAAKVGRWLGSVVSALRRAFRRPPVEGWSESAVRFSTQTSSLLHDRWLRITAATLISHVSLYLVLLVALRHVGVSNEEVSWVTVLAGFSFVRLISALPITPGGVGVVELGYAAYLGIGLDDITTAQVVAAVLVFRFITYFLPIPFGAGAYIFWRRNRSWRKEPAEEPADSVGET